MAKDNIQDAGVRVKHCPLVVTSPASVSAPCMLTSRQATRGK